MSDLQVTIRECVSVDDFRQCIELERAVWKDDDLNIMPVRLYLISKACNAPTFGAFDQTGRLVGFVHTMVALMDGNVAYHSHMAAVLEEHRHRQIGNRMKLAQRERALAEGVPLIFWTFDPLQSRNAHLNINKLGAVIRRYQEDYYGEGISTMFDVGVPSDRLIAEWWVRSPHVEAAISGRAPSVEEDAPSVSIPGNIAAERERSIEEHLRWRHQVREDFKKTLANGVIVRGFARDDSRSESRYLFGPDEEQFHFDYYREGVTRVA